MDKNTVVKVFLGVVLIAAGTVLANKGLEQAGKRMFNH